MTGILPRASAMVGLVLGMTGAAEADVPVPHVELLHTDGGVTVLAYVTGRPGGDVTGTLTVDRKSGSNSMRSKQSSSVVIPESGRIDIARVAVNTGRPVDLDADLIIENDGAVLGETRLSMHLPETP